MSKKQADTIIAQNNEELVLYTEDGEAVEFPELEFGSELYDTLEEYLFWAETLRDARQSLANAKEKLQQLELEEAEERN